MQKAHDSDMNNYWRDKPNLSTPIKAQKKNQLETAVDIIDDRVIVLDTTKANQVDLLTCVASITLNSTTGILKITLKNGSSTTIDTGLSKLAVNFDYDADPTSPHYEQLILEMADGTYKYIDLSALITQFEFVNSATITWTVGNDGTVTANIINGSITEEMLETNFLANCRLEVSKALGFSQDAEAWAKGTKGGTPVASTDEHYHNNSKYYSEVAHTEADNATTKAQDSEAWAVGKRNGQDVPSTDETYHNNAKYWAEQAEGAVTGNDKVTWYANGILGAKQLIPYPYYETTKTMNGITFTDNGDGTVTVNGTATGIVSYILVSNTKNTPFKRGNYFLSGCPLGGGFNSYILYYQPYSGGQWGIATIDEGNGVNVPIGDEEKCIILIRVFSGATVSNLTFKPMLRLAEDTDDTYQPYVKTNKQLTDEINNKVDWTTNGELGAKNLIPYPYYRQSGYSSNGMTGTYDENGVITINKVVGSATAYFSLYNGTNILKENGTYILSLELTDANNTSIFVQDSNHSGDMVAIRNKTPGKYEVKFSTPTNIGNLTIGLYYGANATETNAKVKAMLRLASDNDDTYQPYAKTNQQLTKDVNSKQNASDNSLNTSNKTVVGAINEVNTAVGTKQNATDNSLNTSNKTVVGAINEVNSSLANQISKLSGFLYVSTYGRTVTINALGSFINDDISNIIPSGKTPIGVVGTVIPTQSLANNLATLSCAVVYDNGYKLRWMLSNNSGSAVTTTVTAYILCAG